MIIKNIPVRAVRSEVLRILNCYEDSPLYEEICEEYDEIEAFVRSAAKPEAAVRFEEGEAFVLMTLGREVSGLIERLFSQGDYMGGMLADTIADQYLFCMDQELTELLKTECAKRQVGVFRRLEAPEGMRMERQRDILTAVKGEEELDVRITAGLMYDPVKSMGYILELSDDPKVFAASHDCSVCKARNCPGRKKPYGAEADQNREPEEKR